MRVMIFLLGLIVTFGVSGKDFHSIAEFNPKIGKLDLTPYVQVLVDQERVYKIDDIANNRVSLKFKNLSETGNSFGFDQSVYWISFTLKNDNKVNSSLILEYSYPLLDDLTLFTEDGQGGFILSKAGDGLPFISRELDYRNFLFHIYQKPGQTQTYYMRLQTDGSMQIPLYLWSSSSFIEYADSTAYAYGIYYGIMIILMLAATVAYFQWHQFLYLSYALYLFSFLLFQMALNGFGFQYLWSDMNGWVNRINSASIGLVVVFGFLFCGVFLRVWQQQDRFKHFYNLFMGIGGLSIVLSLFGDYTVAVKLAAASGILLPPIVLISNVYAIRSGYRPARIFLAAWGIFLIGVFVAGLVYFGFLERNFYSHNSMQIASLLEILILGYVLMDNIRRLNYEKLSESVAAKHLLEQLNEGLESKVAERTRELHSKNKLLSDLALRDSMTSLLNHNTSIDHLDVMRTAAQRYGHSLSVVMLDIDRFKLINDEYGHPVGDKVILAIADVLKHSLRESDSCGRYGGEEFIMLLPETPAEHAFELAESIRRKIMDIRIPGVDELEVSASFGVSVFDQAKPQVDLIGDADKALYQAKENGRNQVVLRANMANNSAVI